MKEFEKQWVKHNGGETHETSCMSHIGYPEAKKFWRAALEFVLSTACKTKHGTLANSIQRSVIEKELNDKPEE